MIVQQHQSCVVGLLRIVNPPIIEFKIKNITLSFICVCTSDSYDISIFELKYIADQLITCNLKIVKKLTHKHTFIMVLTFSFIVSQINYKAYIGFAILLLNANLLCYSLVREQIVR